MSDYRRKLSELESSGDHTTVNTLGYAGMYQMGADALTDLGYMKKKPKGISQKAWMADPNNWTGKGGIDSLNTFLNDPEAQNKIQGDWENVLDGRTKHFKLDKYIGQTIDGIPITAEGIRAGAHLLGHGGMKKVLESGDLSSQQDAFGTTAAKYLSKFAPQQEQRGPGMINSIWDTVADSTAGQVASNVAGNIYDKGYDAVVTAQDKFNRGLNTLQGKGNYTHKVKDEGESRLFKFDEKGNVSTTKHDPNTFGYAKEKGYGGEERFGIDSPAPLSVAKQEGQLISGTLSGEGMDVRSGEMGYGISTVSDEDVANDDTDWEALSRAFANVAKPEQSRGPGSASMVGYGGGGSRLGTGMSFQDFYGL